MVDDTGEMSSSSQTGPSPLIVSGERLGQLIRLKPECKDRYVALHAHPFPGLIEQLRASNLHNYSIFLGKDLLFSFFEYVGNDFETDMEAVAENATVQDWWTLTDSMQETLAPEESDQWWVPMEELYHIAAKTTPSSEAERKACVRWLTDDPEGEVRRAYVRAEPALNGMLKASNLQNYGVYLWQNQLCIYFEYTGDDLGSDIDRLHRNRTMQELQQTLDSLSADQMTASNGEHRLPMDCVFYMR